MSESLYFIGVVPPPKLREEITQLKVLVAERFDSKHALKSPPHITLHMPFKWKDKKKEQLEEVMKSINKELEPFPVELKNFNFFEPRVVFVDVQKNDALTELQKNVTELCRKKLNLDNANYRDRPFHPHMTIGFRDLRKPAFYEAKNYFKQRAFEGIWMVEEVSLLKYDGKRWGVEL